MQLLWCIQSLRFLTFFLSTGAFICHLIQCILFNTYQEKTGIPDWLTAGHWQYLLWFISLGLSLVESLVLCLNACYYNKPRKYCLDIYIGSFAIVPILAAIITATLSFSLEPWTFGFTERSENTIISSCKMFDISHDKHYPLLYQRCLLSDVTWIVSIALCILWILLVGLALYAFSLKRKEVPHRKLVEEPTWGRYIPDRSSSIYSATTVGNRSGLLTPSSVKKQLDFYYGAPSLPTLFYDPKPKEETYKISQDEYPVSYPSSTRPKLTIDCSYKSDPDSSIEPVSGTPLYNSFTRKTKKVSLSFRD